MKVTTRLTIFVGEEVSIRLLSPIVPLTETYSEVLQDSGHPPDVRFLGAYQFR